MFPVNKKKVPTILVKPVRQRNETFLVRAGGKDVEMPGEGGRLKGCFSKDTENRQAAGSWGRREGCGQDKGRRGRGMIEQHGKLKGKTMLQALEGPGRRT